ncbi:serine hydrolase [Fredinandcohnia onubensis]|uniref:serine hydrolase n=1 Tax=Fredinandcohnia onubensis TaxID=1571209 RepID=UPI000C0C08C3|nr:serine hydrolase [Fredinandcohnia onubensis]
MIEQFENLRLSIDSLLEDFSGSISLEVRSRQGDKIISYNENEVFPTASTIKVFILGAMLEQVQNDQYSLTDLIEMRAGDQVGGSGVIKEFTPGSKYPIRDVATAMIILSDNTATNMILELVGGIDVVNTHIKKYGYTYTELRNIIDFQAIGEDVENLAVSTSAEFVDYLEKILNNKILKPEIKDVMIDIMARQQYLDLFPRYIPYNPYAKELGVTQDIQIANKTGFFMGVRCDVGYIFIKNKQYVFTVFSKNCADRAFNPENEAAVLIGKLGKEIFSYLSRQ